VGTRPCSLGSRWSWLVTVDRVPAGNAEWPCGAWCAVDVATAALRQLDDEAERLGVGW
jgi:hypothetical protein